MALSNSKKPSLNQVLKLVDQLTPEEQEELCYKLSTKVRSISIKASVPAPKNERLNKIRKSAQEALKKAGVTVDELQEEAKKVREERCAKDFPDLANAS